MHVPGVLHALSVSVWENFRVERNESSDSSHEHLNLPANVLPTTMTTNVNVWLEHAQLISVVNRLLLLLLDANAQCLGIVRHRINKIQIYMFAHILCILR